MTTPPESFPIPFLERIETLFDTTTKTRILEGMATERQVWFRVNPLAGGNEAVFDALAAGGHTVHRSKEWNDAGWVPESKRAMLLASSEVSSGKVYVQGLASQLPVRVLEPVQEDVVLDLAAAPGSKTLQLAAAAPGADIAAVEIVRKRKFRLQDNLARHGAEGVKVFLQDGTKVWRYRPEHFDKVLLDAPCSSEGRFRFHDPESYSFWTRSKTKEMVRKQRRLLFSAIHTLKPGGTLVYSTCSLAPEENEGVVHHALSIFSDCLDVVPIEWDAPERIPVLRSVGRHVIDKRVDGACRLIPSERMEGFFVCRFVKKTSSNPPLKFKAESKR